MWERFEEYLNDGEYGEAGIGGMMLYAVDSIYRVIGVAACIGIVGAVIIYRKKKEPK